MTKTTSDPPQWGARAIADDIRRQIAAGNLRPGDRLPTRRELAERYRVSESTVTNALSRLDETGHTVGRQGQAVYVA
jgi:DNA-binding GntR family transcriptional regulator